MATSGPQKKSSIAQQQSLMTAAGHSVTALIYPNPSNTQRLGICIIAPATGVPQSHYRDFAHWLSSQGYTAISFDYDGTGLSMDRPIKDCPSDKLSWANNDCPAVLAYARANYPDDKLIWIGHSVGAHMLGMMPNTDGIDSGITVGAGTGTWWHNPPASRWRAWFLWRLLVPTIVPLVGYFPGKRLKILNDLPKGVILQWRRWCFKEGYAVESEGEWLQERFTAVKMPITALSFSDDELLSEKNMAALNAFFTNASLTTLRIKPSDIDQSRIGHVGWHKQRYEELWRRYFLPALQESQPSLASAP